MNLIVLDLEKLHQTINLALWVGIACKNHKNCKSCQTQAHYPLWLYDLVLLLITFEILALEQLDQRLTVIFYVDMLEES